MSYRVSLSAEAEKTLDRMDRVLEKRCRLRLLELANDPFEPRLSAPLKQRAGVRKSRLGGWRILFTVDRDHKVIHVATIDTRGQVYKRH